MESKRTSHYCGSFIYYYILVRFEYDITKVLIDVCDICLYYNIFFRLYVEGLAFEVCFIQKRYILTEFQLVFNINLTSGNYL